MGKYVGKDIICAKMMYCNFRSPDMTVSDFINDELPAADVQPIDRWTSVDESLPPDNKPCVVMTKKNGLGVSRLMGRNRTEWTLFGEPVLYWLPIPELPEPIEG